MVETSMPIARPDPVIRALTALASFAYYFMWCGAVVIVVALPVLKAVGGPDSGFSYGLELIAVRRGLAPDSSLTVPAGFHADLTLVPVALVLIALAEVFRRGALLEDEQSLVV